MVIREERAISNCLLSLGLEKRNDTKTGDKEKLLGSSKEKDRLVF